MAWPESRETEDGLRWYIFERFGGKKVSLKLGSFMTIGLARDACTIKNAEKIQGKLEMPGMGPSLIEARNEFLTSRRIKASTLRIYTRHVNMLVDHLGGDVKLSGITKVQMHRFRDSLLRTHVKDNPDETYSVNGIRIIMASLRAFFGFWVDEREAIKANPCHKILHKFGAEDVWRFLSSEEIIRIAEACDPTSDIWNIITVGLRTGLRVGAIAQMIRSDYHGGRLKVKWKTKKTFNIPIVDEIQPLFERIKSGPIFPGWSINRIEHVFAKVVERSGIGGRLRFHDLRHTFASHYLTYVPGANLRELQELLCHTSITMASRYAHIEQSQLGLKANLLPRLPIVGTIWADEPKHGTISDRMVHQQIGELVAKSA